jgi:hypothetical protein
MSTLSHIFNQVSQPSFTFAVTEQTALLRAQRTFEQLTISTASYDAATVNSAVASVRTELATAGHDLKDADAKGKLSTEQVEQALQEAPSRFALIRARDTFKTLTKSTALYNAQTVNDLVGSVRSNLAMAGSGLEQADKTGRLPAELVKQALLQAPARFALFRAQDSFRKLTPRNKGASSNILDDLELAGKPISTLYPSGIVSSPYEAYGTLKDAWLDRLEARASDQLTKFIGVKALELSAG